MKCRVDFIVDKILKINLFVNIQPKHFRLARKQKVFSIVVEKISHIFQVLAGLFPSPTNEYVFSTAHPIAITFCGQTATMLSMFKFSIRSIWIISAEVNNLFLLLTFSYYFVRTTTAKHGSVIENFRHLEWFPKHTNLIEAYFLTCSLQKKLEQ